VTTYAISTRSLDSNTCIDYTNPQSHNADIQTDGQRDQRTTGWCQLPRSHASWP